MKRLLVTACLLAASTNVFARAADSLGDWRYEALRDDHRLSELFDHDVQSMGDRSMGRIGDIIIGRNGELAAAVVDIGQASSEPGVATVVLEWSDVVVEPVQDAVTVSIGSDNEPAQSFDAEGVAARDVLGRRVVLADSQVLGEVVDMFIDLDRDNVSALLVEAGDSQYALPVQGMTFEPDADVVRLPFDRQEAMQRGREAASGLQAANR